MMSRDFGYFWASCTTAMGLLFLPFTLVTGGSYQLHSGVVEIYGGFARLFLRYCTLCKHGASAMTLGHVVLAQNAELLDLTRSHERVHVRQNEQWGPLWVPAYLASSLSLLLRGRDPYLDNPFEIEAYALE